MPVEITGEPLRAPLKKKAQQHAALRKANYPYVLAIYLEPWRLSAREVARAWFGEEVWTVDIKKMKVVDSKIDKTGLHFHGNHVQHTSVSGTLVFRAERSSADDRWGLKAWYIENPFAAVYLPPSLFPVEAAYVAAERTATSVRMQWQPNPPE